ncbi:MAG: AAA family ATPase [Bacteroidales bacterium]
MYIIGITGTLGAGKGTVVDYLVKNKGFTHFSARAFLIKEIEKRHLAVNRDSMTLVANELRTQKGASYIVDELYKAALASGTDAIIESIRSEGEINSLREKAHFTLWAVDADPKIRFDRIKKRKSETDHIDYPTFLANEAREMHSDNPYNQNLQKCIALSDAILLNNEEVSSLEQKVEKLLAKIK